MLIKDIHLSYKCDNCKKERYVCNLGANIDLNLFPSRLGNRVCGMCKGVMRVTDAKCVISETDIPLNLRKGSKSKSNSLSSKNPLLKQYIATWKCKLCGYVWKKGMWMQEVDAEKYFTPDSLRITRIADCTSETCNSKSARIIALNKLGS